MILLKSPGLESALTCCTQPLVSMESARSLNNTAVTGPLVPCPIFYAFSSEKSSICVGVHVAVGHMDECADDDRWLQY